MLQITSSTLGCRILPSVVLALLLAGTVGLAQAATEAASAQLTIERLFAEPDLAGPGMRLLKVAPDGQRITFLRASEQDRFRYDLWEYNIERDQSRVLVDSRVLQPKAVALSDEEKARRERKRISSHTGIVEYYFSQDGRSLLFPLGGDLYVYDLHAKAGSAVRRLTDDNLSETDARFSPAGTWVSFVRGQNLYVVPGKGGEIRALTTDGAGPVRNAMAEFIAQEEMGRDTGYWWSPDEQLIAFTRTDDSQVQLARRFEIYATEFSVFEQRYPAAGTNNVTIQLGVVDVSGGSPRWIDLGAEKDVYIARVDWFPDGHHLLVQRQSRDQKRLDLLKADVRTGESRLLFSEESDTWIDLHDDLLFLRKRDSFIWASSRNGYKHLYLYGNDGEPQGQLTAGNWVVASAGRGKGLLGADEAKGLVYFQGTLDSAMERHLYSVALGARRGNGMKKLTQRAGWHDITLSDNAQVYVDLFSNSRTPPQVSVHGMNGKRITWLQENALQEGHPYWPYWQAHSHEQFGQLGAEDGQPMYYRLVRPHNFDPSRKYPVIVDVYGGPHGQKVKNIWSGYPRTSDGGWRQYLAQRGYVVFTLDNRGTSFRGRQFDAPIYHRMGQSEVRDQVKGVEFLRTLPYVDGERIGVFGWSYGGYMALMCMMQAPEHFAAGVSGAPVTDWRLYDTHYTERYMGDPRSNGEAYDRASVLSYHDQLQGPLLLIHGMADDNVLFSHSTALMKALQEEGLTFDLMTYPGSKHGMLRHRSSGIHGYRSIERFFEMHLAP